MCEGSKRSAIDPVADKAINEVELMNGKEIVEANNIDSDANHPLPVVKMDVLVSKHHDLMLTDPWK